ncbi:hypothetical protein KGM_206152 [Danaus plexippus plexippus]|uniref:Uncharacterized protein n=2 Tax=Danaus TaxID=13036 RepID=A0A212EXX3_DANPL|nr:hypothetical protein KGM_206152 [Danaus plexippus plexippus]
MPATGKLRVFNIVVKTPSGNFRVLQALEDSSVLDMDLDPKDNKEIPHRINLFYNDTLNIRVWEEVMVDHILTDVLIGVQPPN